MDDVRCVLAAVGSDWAAFFCCDFGVWLALLLVATYPQQVSAAPLFVPGLYKKGRRQWVPHVALCLFELASLAMTDPTGRGDFHGDVEAARRANTEDPKPKIHHGAAVIPISA